MDFDGFLEARDSREGSQESCPDEDCWEMPDSTGNIQDLSNETLNRGFAWHGDPGGNTASTGLQQILSGGIMDSFFSETAGESRASSSSRQILPEQPPSGGSVDSRQGGLWADPSMFHPEQPRSSGSFGLPEQPRSTGSFGLPEPPRSSGSFGLPEQPRSSGADGRVFVMPEQSRTTAPVDSRVGGIWDVDALTIPSMCDESVRVQGEWGSNIAGGGWGQNLVLPGLAALAEPVPESLVTLSPGSGQSPHLGPVGHLEDSVRAPAIDDELVKLRQEREALQQRMRMIDQVSPSQAASSDANRQSYASARTTNAPGKAEGPKAKTPEAASTGAAKSSKKQTKPPGAAVTRGPEAMVQKGGGLSLELDGSGKGDEKEKCDEGWEEAGRAGRRRKSGAEDEKRSQPRGASRDKEAAPSGGDANGEVEKVSPKSNSKGAVSQSPRRGGVGQAAAKAESTGKKSSGMMVVEEGAVKEREVSARAKESGKEKGKEKGGKESDKDKAGQAAGAKGKGKDGGAGKRADRDGKGGKSGRQKESNRWKREEEEPAMEEAEEGEADGSTGGIKRFLMGLFHMEQDIGSCIFTVVYFWILFLLHGPTVRLLFIAVIVLVQLSYQVQYPKIVWDPVRRGGEYLRHAWAGLWVGEAQIAAATNRGGQRRRVRGDTRRWKTPLGWRLVGWGSLAMIGWFVVSLLMEPDPVLPQPFAAIAAMNGKPLLISRMHIPVSPSSKHSQADRLCEEAQAMEYRLDWAQVIVRLESALQLDPGNICSLYNYGRLLEYHWNNPDRAEEMYRRALEFNPKHVPTLRNLGYLLFIVRKEWRRAEQLFMRALQENPKEVDVLSGYGSLLQENRNYKQAEAYFLKALKLRPTHMHTLHKYGRILLYVKGDAVDAEKHFKGALEQAPHHIPALVDYAQLLLSFSAQLGLHPRRGVDKAVELLDRIVQINPNHVQGLYLLAAIEHFLRGRAAKAERFYRRVLERIPDHLPTLPKYGMLLMSQGKVDAAEALFKRMSEVDGNKAPIEGLIYYGHLLRIYRNDHQAAMRLYKRALKLRPTKTVPLVPEEGVRCWLCTNSSVSRLHSKQSSSAVCCGKSAMLVEDEWWLEPALRMPADFATTPSEFKKAPRRS